MNHNFNPSKINILNCTICKRPYTQHKVDAECESCGKTDVEKGNSKLEIVNDILLCRDCVSRELESLAEGNSSSSNSNNESIEENPIEEITTIRTSFIERNLPANGSEYYNAQIMSNIELEKRIWSDDTIPAENHGKEVFLAKQLQADQQKLYKTLIEVKTLISEIGGRQHANYVTINELAHRLTREEREKLNIKYAEYQPSTKIPKVRQPRVSAEEKVIEGLAKLMFAPQKDGIVQWEALEAAERQSLIEKARQYYKGTLK